MIMSFRSALCTDAVVVEPERRQWKAWNFVGFWIADSFNIVCYVAQYMIETDYPKEYVDDLLFDDRRWPVMVAIVDLVCHIVLLVA